MKKPNILYETIMSVIKYFLIFVFINNLAWVIVIHSLTSGAPAEITQSQDGTNNTQEMRNG